MQPIAAIANTLWSASNLPAFWRFKRALGDPGAQQTKLRTYLERNAGTSFGIAHKFHTIRSYEEFTRCVPTTSYDALEPWIDRIRGGEPNVLTHDPVTHLIPTSGSSGPRKLIPFTAGSQREFNAAIGPWLLDLLRGSPGLLPGPAYWSVTPVLRNNSDEPAMVPIGFDSDAAYLGGARRRLAEAVMAVPPEVQHAHSLDAFRHETLLHLLRCPELRLISVWHPSFLALLLDSLPANWDTLLHAVARGSGNLSPAPRRAAQLRAATPFQPESIWPQLKIISCWGEGAAEAGAADLQRRFPNALLQTKGLIATEAVVTLPFSGRYPLAVTSHFFEFIDESERVVPVEALCEGLEYEVVVTTASGLWRYRLADRVRVTGWMGKTPTLRFLGRAGIVSDRFGEKLSEPFVAAALAKVFGTEPPQFAMLAPHQDDLGCRYTLYLQGLARPQWAHLLDLELRSNPHYAYCRDLGQLLPVTLFIISERGFETFARRRGAEGVRLGDIKPTALCRSSGWSQVFRGQTAPVGSIPEPFANLNAPPH